MHAQVERLARLVRDLLDLSRLEAGVVPLHLAPVALVDLVHTVVDDVRGTLPGLRSTSWPTTTTQGAGRRRPPRPGAHEPAHQRGPLQRPGAGDRDRHATGARLDVVDDGPGIPAGEEGRIFERFYRADRARNAAGPASASPSPAGSSTCTAAPSAPSGSSRTAAAWSSSSPGPSWPEPSPSDPSAPTGNDGTARVRPGSQATGGQRTTRPSTTARREPDVPARDAFKEDTLVAGTFLYDEAAADYQGFWARQAAELLDWIEDWDTICEWELPYAKWFVGGKLNVSLQLPRPPRRRRPRRQGGHPLGGRAGRHPHASPTPSCSTRCSGSPTC